MMTLVPMIRRIFRRPATVALLSWTAIAAMPAMGQAAVHVAVTGAVDSGPVAGGSRISVTLYLKPDAARNAALDTFLQAVNEPGSATYHQWLTPAAFAAQFGASDNQTAWLQSAMTAAGLQVDRVSGLRMTLSGPAGVVESVLAPGLHTETFAGSRYLAATAVAKVPAAIAADVTAVGGMTSLPEAHPLMLTADGQAVAAGGLGALEDLAGAVEANSARVLALHGAACAGEFAIGEQDAVRAMLREAEAQGMTVLAESGCAAAADVSFPAALGNVTAVVSPGPGTDISLLAGEVRPSWQMASGLPDDGMRHSPDAMVVAGIDALASTLESLLVTMSANADGSEARLGNVAAVLYRLAPEPMLFAQPDGAASGTWEPGTGLGTLNLKRLAELYPRGTLSTYIQVNTSPLFATHGAPITFIAAVKDISGNGTTAPSGTVTFTTDTGSYALGTATLTPAGATSSTAQVTYSKLPVNGYNVIATYSGDANYAGNSNQTYFTIGPEEGTLSASFPASVAFGATIPVVITDTAPSGVGTPMVTGYIIPQGISNPPTYSVVLTPSTTTASSSGTVYVPATNAGTMTLLLGCTSKDVNFTCYNSSDVQVAVAKAMPTAVLLVQPSQLVAGLPVLLTMTVTGIAGQATPSGSVIFFDNGVNVGSTTLDATGKAQTTLPSLTSATGHAYTATYYGDNNYAQASAAGNATSGTVAATIAITCSASTVATGGTATLTATVASGSTSSTAVPTGTVTFTSSTQGALGTATLNAAGVAVLSPSFTTAGASTITAAYSGSTTYSAATTATGASVTVSSVVGAIATVTTIGSSASTVATGGTVTLTAVVASGSSSSVAVPTGTVTFTSSTQGVLGTGTVNSAGVAVLTPTFTTSGASTITASYAGNATYAASTTASGAAVTVSSTGTAKTTTTVASSSNTVATGGTVTLTATVSVSTGTTTIDPGTLQPRATAVPTGTVTFTSSTQGVLGSATLNSAGVAVLAPVLTTAGASGITATYSGDANYAASTAPAAAPLQVGSSGAVASTTTIASTASTVSKGGTATLTATVASGSTSSTTTPTGTVTFTSSTQGVLGTATLNSAGVAVLAPVFTTSGASTITAAYSGDTTYGVSTTATGAPLSVTGSGTVAATVAVATSTATVAKGSTATLTATVSSGSGSSTTVPTGTVTFTSSTQGVLGTATLNSAGVAALAPTFSTAGASTITATYSGDSIYNVAAGTAAETVGSAGSIASTTTVTSSATTVTSGGAATLTATVASGSTGTTGIPTGTVTFTSSTQGVLGTATLNAAGVATLAGTFTTAGAATITATYSGDATFAVSSGTTAVTVSSTTTPTGALTLTVNPTITTYGSSISLTANVAATPTSGTTGPAGTVTFAFYPNNGGTAITYTAVLSPTSGSTAVASLTVATLAAGTYTLVATCTGTNFSCAGLQGTAGVSVQKAPTTLALAVTPPLIVSGQPTQLTATLTLNSGSTVLCTGIVTFYVAGSSFANVALSGNQASYVLTLPSGITNSLSASYSGDPNCVASTSPTVTITAPTASTSTSVYASLNTILLGGADTFTANVVSIPSATVLTPGVPAGTVNFYDTLNGVQTLIGSAALIQTGTSGAQASVNTTGLKVGTHVITAVYAGVTGYAPSTSTSVVVSVQDFTVTFAPSQSTVAKGGTATAIALVTPVNGFSGNVVLGCVPPAGSASTCTFSPNILSGGSGSATLTISTTAATANLILRPGPGRGIAEGVSLAGLLVAVFAPARRRKLARLALALAVAGTLMFGTVGCTTTGTVGSGTGSGGTSGTPSGTLQYSITASGTDGRTSETKTLYYSLTVQ